MNNNRNLWLLLTPSWLVSVLATTVAIVATAGVIVASRYQGSQLRQIFFEVQSSDPSASAGGIYRDITANVSDNQFLGALPLLLFWAGIGLIVYFVAIAIAKAFGEIVEISNEFDYVHVSRRDLIRQELLKLGIRVSAVIGWLIFIKLTIAVFMPYALAAANIASQSLSFESVLYVLLSVAVIYVVISIHAVFLRLIALKPRLFGV